MVQASPVLFDRDGGLERVGILTRDAANGGAGLIVFPEAILPGYPRGLSFGATVGGRTPEGRRAWQRFWENAVDVPGPCTEALGAIARDAQAYLVIGVVERDRVASGGTLYCTLLYFGPDGSLLGVHRKLKPTASERLIWGEGDGSTLTVLDTPIGRVGGLICWENYMPLARMAMYGKGVEIYLAPTADARETWQATMRHIACEGRCFVLGANQFVTKSMYPDEFAAVLTDEPEAMCRGGSVIVSPLGEVLAGPLYDQEGILHADLDMGEIPRGKFDFDVTGHYARPDVFRLLIDERPRSSVEYRNARE